LQADELGVSVVLTTQLFKEQLEKLEQQINRYQKLLSSGPRDLKFPNDIERDYNEHSNAIFVKSSRLILSFGALLYLAFGFSDYALGQEQADTLWLIRAVISATVLVGITVFFNHKMAQWVITATTVGMIVIGLSLVLFIYMLKEPYSYAYHFGLVPWQVFILISLRSYLKAIAVSSITVFVCYILVAYTKDFVPYHPEVDRLIYIMLPMFTAFWALLIAMGIYLGYHIERSARVDFVKNRLLSIDAQRLTLLSEELHLLSTTDSLTGLANRRHFESCFDLEWRRAIRSEDSIALIMIDIDNFKKYNDLYGHQAGDECLRQVSASLHLYAQRSGELVVRYGGEEFLVLLPRMTLAHAQHIAEKVCRNIRELNITHANSNEKMVTISIGVAAMVPGQNDDEEALLRDADRALYQAKANGRNCVVS
jgi:diguanylate cyclase (GGDEF)-like protein